MQVENLVFNWKKTGENNRHDVLEVECCGHEAKIYRSCDGGHWCSMVDRMGVRMLENEKDAISLTEERIKDKIINRFKEATSDLSLFSSQGLVFVEKQV